MKFNILLSRWLSRCILRVTSEEIKLKYRQLEKCKLKNIKEKSHLVLIHCSQGYNTLNIINNPDLKYHKEFINS